MGSATYVYASCIGEIKALVVLGLVAGVNLNGYDYYAYAHQDSNHHLVTQPLAQLRHW
jgi:hypothetical protein